MSPAVVLPLLFALLTPLPPQPLEIPLLPAQISALQSPPQGEARRQLIRELETLLRLDDAGDFDNAGLLVSLAANLDERPDIELAVLFGRQDRDAHLLVIDARGVIKASLPVENFFGDPELLLVTSGQSHKLLVVRELDDEGTGVYADSQHFYRLLDGRLKGVLRLPAKAYLNGWGGLNQNLQVQWRALSGGEDAINVSYRYRFAPSPGPATEDAPDWSWLEGEESVDFLWDDASQSYQPDFYPHHPLDALKLQSLETLGDQTLFFKAFGPELYDRWLKASASERARMRQLGWK